MKKIIILCCVLFLCLTGCSSAKNNLYQNGTKELENGNYEKAIECFKEYQKNYGEIIPLKDSYRKYANYFYENNDYINSLYYYKLAKGLDNTDSTIQGSITNLTGIIYEQGKQFLNNNEELLAFQYLSFIKNDIDIDNNLIPEEPLLGIWSFDNNYIKLTKSSMSYISSNTAPSSSDFTEDYILILGDWYINDEGNVEIDDHYLTHQNEHYIKYIRIIDNNTIYIEGNNTLTGEYKRIK